MIKGGKLSGDREKERVVAGNESRQAGSLNYRGGAGIAEISEEHEIIRGDER